MNSPGWPGTGVRVGRPVAINTSPEVVRKTSYDVTWGGGLVMNTVLAPLSTPVTVPSSLPNGSFDGILVSAMEPLTVAQSARASTAVPATATQSSSASCVYLLITKLLFFPTLSLLLQCAARGVSRSAHSTQIGGEAAAALSVEEREDHIYNATGAARWMSDEARGTSSRRRVGGES